MARYTTKQRKILEDCLMAHLDKKVSVKDILSCLKNKGISQSSVYRNLAAMEKDGKLKRFVSEDSNEILYQYLADEDCRNHIHLTCTRCGKISHMSTANSMYIEKHIENDEQFYMDKGDTVIYGLCSQCREKENTCKKK